MNAERFVLIGVDGLDSAVLSPLLHAGLMPHMARMLGSARHGPLTPVLPDCPPACWATLLTGRWPDDHGVLAAQELDPVHGGARPADSACLRAPALWDHLAAAGRESFRVGLALDHPACGPGVCVSGAYPGEYQTGGNWSALPEGALHGLDAQEMALLDELRVHPNDIRADAITPLVPGLSGIDPTRDRRPAFVGVALARSLSLHNAATWLLEDRPQACALIRYPLLDELSRYFLAYHPPRLTHLSEADYAAYRGVVSGAYRLLDMMLGRIAELAGTTAALFLISTYGFRLEPAMRASALDSGNLDGPPLRHEGWWLMTANGLNRQTEALPATVLDIAPSALACLGLIAASDLSGQSRWPGGSPDSPLVRCPAPHPESVRPGPDTDASDRARVSAWLDELAHIGRPDPLAADLAAQRVQTRVEQAWHLFRILKQRGEQDAALACMDGSAFQAVYRRTRFG